MRILHLHTQLNISCGITKTIFLLSKNTKAGQVVSVFVLGGDAISKFISNKIEVNSFNLDRRKIIHSFLALHKLFLLIRENKIQIIHSHHRYFDLLAFFLSKVTNVKTITSVQSKVYGKRALSYKADQLIACSYAMKEHLIAYFKVDSNRINVIHNFVDLDEISNCSYPNDFKEKIVGNKNIFVIGYVGRLNIAEKGIDILLEAYYKLTTKLNNIVLLMVGNGPDANFVKEYAKSKNIEVVFVGAQEDVYPFISVMDLVVIPSVVEPFGIVAIEAGIMKKAVIASNVDGLKEIIDNEVNGILVNELNCDSFMKEMLRLLSDSVLRKNYGDLLSQKVINSFSSTVCISKYNRIYEKIIDD